MAMGSVWAFYADVLKFVVPVNQLIDVKITVTPLLTQLFVVATDYTNLWWTYAVEIFTEFLINWLGISHILHSNILLTLTGLLRRPATEVTLLVFFVCCAIYVIK